MEEQPAVDPTQDLTRKARPQVPGPVTHEPRPADKHGPVNIWSGRRAAPRTPKEERVREPSKYRCKPKLDAGRTRGSEGQINTFCLFFAKGMCYQGSACTYLHRLPTSADNQAYATSTSQDIFGREKQPDHLDNRKGAGSYERDMTTLYVNYGGAGNYATPQLRHLLLENFGEWGPIRSVYIVPSKTIAFVKFHWRVSAEFAKEAMDCQPLIGSSMKEVLSVRWANDDPNPVTIISRKREALDAAEEAAMAAWALLPPEEKRARMAMMHAARARKVSAVADALPRALADPSVHDALGFDGTMGFKVWAGRPGAVEEADDLAEAAAEASAATAAAADGEQQQQQQQQEGSLEEQWAAYYAAHPEAYAAACQQQQQQQEQQPAGAWYQGWRQRQLPGGIGSAAPAAGAAASAGDGSAAAGGAAGNAGAAALGLLAGYSSSDSDDEEAGGGEKEQQQQPEQEQQQRPEQEQQQLKQPSDALATA